MTLQWLKAKIGCGILTVLLLSLFPLVSTTNVTLPKERPCGQDIQTGSTQLVFCSPKNKTTVITIPYTALVDAAGNRGHFWGKSYSWYAMIGSGWGILIGETDYDWSDWSQNRAKQMRQTFHIDKTDEGLILTYTPTRQNLTCLSELNKREVAFW